jgi:hypothetical protein
MEGKAMNQQEDNTGGMDELAEATAQETNEYLKEREVLMLQSTKIDINSLRPQISDKESFDKLIQAVAESTKQNENIAALKDRLTGLGEGVVKVAKEVYKLSNIGI